MSKLGDRLRALADTVEKSNLVGVGFIGVGDDYACDVALEESNDHERDAMVLGMAIYQVTNMKQSGDAETKQ